MSHPSTNHDESLSEVNVIPLADLSLVLLIILMIMSPMVSQAIIQISAAKAAAAQVKEDLPAEPETPVIVTYSPDALKLNGVVMGTDMDFVMHLDTLMQHRKDKSVILTAAPELLHGQVVRMMDVVKRHGAETLVLVKWEAKGS